LCAYSLGLPFFVSKAVRLGRTIFSIPPVFVLTIGLFEACASIKLTGVPSFSDVRATISKPE